MDETRESYELGLEAYRKRPRQPEEDEKAWIRRALSGLSREASIFEIGSGTAERSDYIESLGYLVQRSDVAQSFLDFLSQRNYELRPVFFDLRKDEPPLVHCFFASAVLLHLTHEETPTILRKLKKKLLPGGRLIASWKVNQGEREEQAQRDGLGERYWSYWTRDELRDALSSWIDVTIEEREGWLQVVAFSSGKAA